MRIVALKTCWFVLGVGLIALPSFAGEIPSEGETSRKSESVELAPLRAFTDLTKTLNHVAAASGVAIRILPLGNPIPFVSQPQALSVPPKPTKDNALPALSTDESQINPVDTKELGLTGFANISGVAQVARDALGSQGLLPLPQARIVSPVGEKTVQEALEAPMKNILKAKEPDVISSLSPMNTRFGKDKYDQSVFSPSSAPQTSLFGAAPEPDSGASKGFGGLPPNTPSDDSVDKKDSKEKNQLQEARESFQKTMLEFAERTEDKAAFNLVDYYDLKSVLANNEHVLGMFENEEIDQRFVKNAQIIFDRFGDKDSTQDKRPFERFLKRMAPPEEGFNFPAGSPKSGNSSRRKTHRGEVSQ